MKIKKIVLLGLCILLLTACTTQIDELKEKVQEKVQEQDQVGENGKDPNEMSLEEIGEELESMEDVELDEDLKEIEGQL